jgi:hypothetical protein
MALGIGFETGRLTRRFINMDHSTVGRRRYSHISYAGYDWPTPTHLPLYLPITGVMFSQNRVLLYHSDITSC